ncbi:MAG: hypothetical protein ACI32B_01810 [Erysipelotrichaceae bacterium]
MRNRLLICFLLVFIIIISGCKQDENQYFNDNDSKFVLFDDRYYYLCTVDDLKENIEINAKLKRSDEVEGLGFIYEYIFKGSERYYLKTQTNKKLETYIQTFSKDGKEENTIQTNRNFYSACVSDDKLYTVSSYVDENPYLVLEVFDNSLSMIYSNSFEFDASLMFPSGIFIYENEIYVFCGVAPRNYKYGDIINYLFRFDSEFNLLENRELELHDGGYQSICRIDNLLYMAKTMQGLDENGYAIGSNYIDTYNLKTGELVQDCISLEYTHPLHIRYDEYNNNLIIMHDRYSLGMNVYSIYNLEDGTVKSFIFNYDDYGDYSVDFNYHKDEYYFQTPEKLGIYNMSDSTMREYDLAKLGLEIKQGILALE